MHRSRLFPSLAAAAALLLSATTASATTLLHLGDAGQAELSTAVVVATVGAAETAIDPRGSQPWTRTEIRVEEVLAGRAPRLLTVQQIGGTVGDTTLVLHGDARLRSGERCVLFLREVDGGWFLTNLEESKHSLVETPTGTALVRAETDGQLVVDEDGRFVPFVESDPSAARTLDDLRSLLGKGAGR